MKPTSGPCRKSRSPLSHRLPAARGARVRPGGTAARIGTGAGPTVRLIGLCEVTRQGLTLTATDRPGNVRQDTVEVLVRHVC